MKDYVSKADIMQRKGTHHSARSSNALNVKDTGTKRKCAQRNQDAESALRNTRLNNAIEGKPNALTVKILTRPDTMNAHIDKKKTNG